MPAPATTLLEAAVRLNLAPLADGSNDHVNLAEARSSNILGALHSRLEECVTNGNTTAHLAFVGHRGSGKTTELLRLAHLLSHSFFSVHLELDASLEMDADYPEVMLWMVEGIATAFKDAGIPFDDKHLDTVAKWFATVTREKETSTSKEIQAETEASFQAGFKVPGFGAKLIGKLKSAIKGDSKTREHSREQVKKTGDELITTVNTFLAAARAALEDKHPGRRLLIIQDNLDRLEREPALRIFQTGADKLKLIEAICLWTPPVGSLIAPFNVKSKFETYYMPMISVLRRDGSENKHAIAKLTELLAARMDLKQLFATPSLVKQLVLLSGGSPRELLELTDRARLNARAEGRTRISKADVLFSGKDTALSLQNALIPNNVYFPILAEIARHKRFEADLDGGYSPDRVDARREFFHRLIHNEAAFYYNGESAWIDVHPALHLLRDFQEALARVPAAPVA